VTSLSLKQVISSSKSAIFTRARVLLRIHLVDIDDAVAHFTQPNEPNSARFVSY
jgi:hypothetical protein